MICTNIVYNRRVNAKGRQCGLIFCEKCVQGRFGDKETLDLLGVPGEQYTSLWESPEPPATRDS